MSKKTKQKSKTKIEQQHQIVIEQRMVIETGAFYFVNENDSLEHDEIVIVSKYTYCEKKKKIRCWFWRTESQRKYSDFLFLYFLHQEVIFDISHFNPPGRNHHTPRTTCIFLVSSHAGS